MGIALGPLGVGLVSSLAGRGPGGAAVDPLSLFTYDIDFVAGTAKGGTQPYGNNTDDGRLFRDPTNTTAGFCPNQAGTLSAVAAAGIKRTDKGAWNYPSTTCRNLWARDMTNAAWVASNVTVAKTQTGFDGTANAASSITASANNGTVLQTITLASSTVLYSADIKRLTGTGTLEMTVDGGTTWTAITGLTSIYQLKFIVQAAVTNPVIGFRIGTSGDSFAVDFNQLINPVNSVNLPSQTRVATTSATILNSQSRPSANAADAAPKSLITTGQGPFAFYWQGRSERASGGFIITGATAIFCSVQSDGSVKFSANAGNASSNVGVWRTGLASLNKVAGCFDGTRIRCACNGTANEALGGTIEAALDHFDLNTNGAGQNSGYGVTERFAMAPNLMFSLADMVAMTT
jgi:hypothetical protein